MNRIDAFLERLYRRLGPRYLVAIRYLAMAVIAIGGGAYCVALLSLYLEPTGAEFVRLVFVSAGLGIAGAGFLCVFSWIPTDRPIDKWLAGARRGSQTLDAWRLSIRLPMTLFRQGAVPAALFVLAAIAYAAAEFELSFRDGVLLGVAGSTGLLWFCALVWLALEIYLRPLRRDLASMVPADSTPDSRLSLALRLLSLCALISFISGWSVAFAATVGDGSIRQFGEYVLIAIAVSLSTSGLLTVLLTRVLTDPLDDVLETATRVSAGDLTARAPITTDDEAGILGIRFNEMLGSLEQFAGENDQLLREVRASRARIVEASDAERRRVERNIHDGAQQRLVALALQLRMLEGVSDVGPNGRAAAEQAGASLTAALEELRELAAGLHPSVLTTDGLAPALEQLASNATVPVEVHAPEERYPEALESTAYFVASEALANVAKYAQASAAVISVERRNGRVIVEIADDGVGGAEIGAGSGLTGLSDRVAALDGNLGVESVRGKGTTVRAELPLVFPSEDDG